MAEKLKLSAEMGAYQHGCVLTAETIQGWAKAAQHLEIDLAQAEEGRRYNSQVIDQRNAEIGRLQQELKQADTAMDTAIADRRALQANIDQLVEKARVTRNEAADRDTMKRALQTALNNGSWLSSELLVDAVLMQLFPQPGKRLEDIPVPQATRPAAALSFEEVTEPVIEWLNEHYNPHYAIMIENDGATVVSTELHHPTTKFIKD